MSYRYEGDEFKGTPVWLEWQRYRADQAAGIRRCGFCDRIAAADEALTEINPEGGHDRPRFMVCRLCQPSFLEM